MKPSYLAKSLLLMAILSMSSLMAVLSVSSQARAAVLTFENLTTGAILPLSSTSYGGFTWSSNFLIVDPILFKTVTGINTNPSGYVNGTVSGDYVAFNNFQSSVSVTRASLFDFNGAYFTAAWHDGLNIQLEGWRNGTMLYTQTIDVDPLQANFFNFDFLGIDELRLSSFGGTQNPTMPDFGTHFAMDNFTFDAVQIPVPNTAMLILSGLACLGLCTRIRRRRAG